MSRSASGGTWRGALVRPAAAWIAAASWLKVRFSGPPIWSMRPRAAGSVTACSTSAATSVTETKLIGLSPRPKTTGRPERAAVWLARRSTARRTRWPARWSSEPRWPAGALRRHASSGTAPSGCPLRHRRPTSAQAERPWLLRHRSG
jgi:hypothetical protein